MKVETLCDKSSLLKRLKRISRSDSSISNVYFGKTNLMDSASGTVFNDENFPLKGSTSLKVYKRRWILIGIFSLLCTMQISVWNTWGPIAITAENYFGWKNSDIALLNNWGNINVLLFILPAMWLLDTKGIRVTVAFSAALLFLATLARCITMKSPYALWLMNFGQFLNGISVIITLIVPALLSSIWFPMEERITAITIMSLACNLGSTLSFLLGLSLTDVGSHNQTNPYPHQNRSHFWNFESDKDRDGKDISMIMYSEFGVSTLLFICILVYFPNKPKLPPSFSASYTRTKFTSGVKDLLRNGTMWRFCLSVAVTFGINSNFITLLPIILKNLDVNQKQCQYMGLYSEFVGIFFPVFIGRFADKIGKIVKILLGILWFLIASTALILLLIHLKYIPNSIVAVYVLVVTLNGSVAVSFPLIWELGCEISYPASEGSTVGFIYFCQNFIGSAFLFFFKIPHIGTDWVLYLCASAAIFGFAIFLTIRVNYHRTHADIISSCDNKGSYGSLNI